MNDHRILSVMPICGLLDEGLRLMRTAMSHLNLSARAYHRILKLVRTIANLAGNREIRAVHLADVLQYTSRLMLE